MNLEFNCQGNEKQLQACEYWLDDSVDKLVYGGAKGGAKSFTGASLIFGDAFIYPGTHYFIAREELNDLRKFTLPTIHEVFNGWGITRDQYKFNGTDNFFTLNNDSKVFLLSCKYLPSDPMFERFGSMQMTRGWIEEAGQVSADAMRNLWLSIGRWKNDTYNLKKKMLITLNPNKGPLYKEIYKPWKDGTLPDNIKFVRALAHDNKKLPEDYIKSLSELTGVARQRLYLGNWEYDDDENQLMTYSAILDLFNNTHVEPKTGERSITADIAFEGSDYFVLMVWEGHVLIHVEKHPKSAGKEVIDLINNLKNKFHVPNSRIVYDADGAGGFLSGRQGFLPGAISFHNNGSPITVNGEKENYENLKAQCSYALAKRVNAGGLWLKAVPQEMQELIIEEIEQVKSRDKDLDGKLKIERKDEVKKNIGRSPDHSDCIMMREIFDLKPAPKRGIIITNR